MQCDLRMTLYDIPDVNEKVASIRIYFIYIYIYIYIYICMHTRTKKERILIRNYMSYNYINFFFGIFYFDQMKMMENSKEISKERYRNLC